MCVHAVQQHLFYELIDLRTDTLRLETQTLSCLCRLCRLRHVPCDFCFPLPNSRGPALHVGHGVLLCGFMSKGHYPRILYDQTIMNPAFLTNQTSRVWQRSFWLLHSEEPVGSCGLESHWAARRRLNPHGSSSCWPWPCTGLLKVNMVRGICVAMVMGMVVISTMSFPWPMAMCPRKLTRAARGSPLAARPLCRIGCVLGKVQFNPQDKFECVSLGEPPQPI